VGCADQTGLEAGVAERVKYYPLVVGGVERSYPHMKPGDGKYAALGRPEFLVEWEVVAVLSRKA
jgi:hypothetical protein